MTAPHFHVLLRPIEDGYFLASVPALRGCHSQGASKEEALANIREAIEGWLEAEDERAIAALSDTDAGELVLV